MESRFFSNTPPSLASHGSAERVIFLNRFFYPDHAPTGELLAQLALALAGNGFQVTVVTSRLYYETTASPLPPRECVHGVDVWRVWTSRRGRQRLTGRSLDYLTFYVAAAWRVWRLSRPGDTIVVMTDPPLMSVMIAPIAWLRGVKLVNWLQDIFPEVAEVLKVGGLLGRATFRLMRRLRNRSLHSARANVVVGDEMAHRLQSQGIKRKSLRVIPNWADGGLIAPIAKDDNELRKSWALNSRFVVGYAGNLGRAHDFETVVDALTLLRDQAQSGPTNALAAGVMFLFVGGGAQRARFEREVLQRRLTNVRMHPYQPRERLGESLSAADIHLVSLNPDLEGLLVPSKFYGIAAAGRPTIFIGAKDGEIARLLEENGCGFVLPPGDGKALANKILELAADQQLCATLGARARLAFERQWNKNQALSKWEALLHAVSAPDLEERP
jgi:glycosyltransferase involved in cell wall biosynthesis